MLQSCLTLCDPIDGSPPGSPISGILQARTLEWVAISFTNAWKWKVKVKSLSRVRLLATPWTAAYQAPPPMGFSRQEYWSGVPLPSLKKWSEVAQSCLTLCDPVDCSLTGSSIQRILQARILEWVAISFSRGSSWPRDQTQVSCIAGRRFTLWASRWAFLIFAAAAKSLQSCLTLCDPIDSSPPGSPVPGILQARTLEWVAISFSNAWKWKVKGKSLSRVRLLATPWSAAYQAPPSMGFSRQEHWSGVPLPSPP